MDWKVLQLALKDLAKTTPKLLGMLIFLGAGWIAAYLLRRATDWALKKVGFDAFCTRFGFSEFLRKGHVGYTPTKLIASAIYWLIIITVLFIGTVLSGMEPFELVLHRVAAGIPNFIGVLLILIIGIVLVRFFGNFFQTIASNANFPEAEVLSRVIKLAGAFFILVLVLEYIGIGEKTLIFSFQVIFAGVVFALAISFGLGCKDMVRSGVERFLKNRQDKDRVAKGPDLEG